MNRDDRLRFRKLTGYRERKRLARLRKNRTYNPAQKGISDELKKNREKLCYTKTYKYLMQCGFALRPNVVDKTNVESISVPKDFSFRDKPDKAVRFLRLLFTVLYDQNKEVAISFEKCNKIDVAPLIYMKLLIRDYWLYGNKQKAIFSNEHYLNRKITYVSSDNEEVNKYLYATFTLNTGENEFKGYKPLFTTDIIVGRKSSKKSFDYNAKGPVCKRMRDYVNKCLKEINLELRPGGINSFDQFIGEILGNAEDHSGINEWYVLGVTFIKVNEAGNDRKVLVNLVVLNIGNSIYEGFQETKDVNIEMHKTMEGMMKVLKKKHPVSTAYLKEESLFTLYALQQGISRRKYKKPSAGNGTIPFIRAFMALGSDFHDDNELSDLLIVSGKTSIKCDKKCEPYQDKQDNMYRLSLNEQQDLQDPPTNGRLKQLKEFFPGTLLSAKIFLDERSLREKVRNND